MGGALDQSPEVAGRRKRLIALCRSLPQAEAVRGGPQHLTFKVTKKIFAYYVYDHHRDGRIALLCKAPPGEQGRLVEENPSRYFVPPHVGPRGWVGLRLDTARVNWTAVKTLVLAAYFMTAPDKLREQSKQRKIGAAEAAAPVAQKLSVKQSRPPRTRAALPSSGRA